MSISSLPVELFIAILLVAEPDPLAISSVCSRWRAVALSTPVLWTRIVLHDGKEDASIYRAAYFVPRAGSLDLHLVRKNSDGSDNFWSSRIDQLTLDLLPRCASFECVDIPKDARSQAFLEIVLRTPCPQLRELSLDTPGAIELMLPSTFGTTINFPALRSLFILGICFPYGDLGAENLTDFDIVHDCDHVCQLHQRVDEQISRLVQKCLSLHSIRADWQEGLEHEHWQLPGPVERNINLHDLLRPTVHEISFVGIPIVWTVPGPTSLIQSPISGLTFLELDGIVTCPYVQDAMSIDPLLSVLARCPKLTHLYLWRWYNNEPDAPSAPRRNTVMPCLQLVVTQHMHAEIFRQLFTALRIPRLCTLKANVNSYGSSEPIWIPRNWSWNFPELETLHVHLSGSNGFFTTSSYSPFPLSDIVQQGSWTSLKDLKVHCDEDYVTTEEVIAALEFLRDPSRTPHLRILDICTPASLKLDGKWLKALRRDRKVASRALGISFTCTIRIT
ncbi:hypothetical protein EXIGLDRAFT_762387 [Exidia glandulosa HHB12029]|uniref:F-box domain-containing protein n=1 Tax=Exidia glandulosa HHB12029 TaxID=1314781 RepID=A0A165MTI6_EXIGL|nr:hypothetical protein EXIGLDRAFT_762387 [Exidia glandulosa HHB12029]